MSTYVFLSENGKYTVQAVSVDNITKERKITYVKMDVEGVEKEAIQGMQVLMKAQRNITHHLERLHFLAELLGMEQSAISHQLRKLRQAKLVCSRKEGRTVYYMLDDDHVRELVAVGFAHLTEE